MKHLFLAVAIIGATVSTSFAQQQTVDLSKTPSAEVVQSGRQALIARTVDLQTALTSKKTDQAQKIASQIFDLMRTRIGQTANAAHDLRGEPRAVIMGRVDVLESRAREFMHASKDVAANGEKLVLQAKAFSADY